MGIFKKLDEMQEKSFDKICKENNISSDLFDDEDMQLIKDSIATNFLGDGYNNVGTLLKKCDMDNLYNMLYPRLNTIITQNFMIIKELKKLNKK